MLCGAVMIGGCYNLCNRHFSKIMQNFTFNSTTIIDNLAEKGYALVDDFLSSENIAKLAIEAKVRDEKGALQPAKTGLAGQMANTEIRGDSIVWLAENDISLAIQTYFSQMHALKKTFNETLFLNLASFETHFSIYPIGAKYGKHLDQFNAGSGVQARQISSILYLNQQWQAEDGGELRLYLSDVNLNGENLQTENYLDIQPIGGRLVLFKSSDFWHEVLPCKAHRISLTGWFRSREIGVI
jgi:SM-20-related protein